MGNPFLLELLPHFMGVATHDNIDAAPSSHARRVMAMREALRRSTSGPSGGMGIPRATPIRLQRPAIRDLALPLAPLD